MHKVNLKLKPCALFLFALASALGVEAEGWHGPAPQFYSLREYDGNTGPSVPVGPPAQVERTSPDSFVVANGTGNLGNNSTYFGALTVFDGNDTDNYVSSTLYTFGQQPGDGFYPGTPVTVGDFNGDGVPDIIVATGSGGANGAGTVQVFTITPTSLIPQTTISLVTSNGTSPGGITEGPDGSLFLTCEEGGTSYGTVCRIARDGTMLCLQSFNGLTGQEPVGAFQMIFFSDGFPHTVQKTGVQAHGLKASDNTITNYTLFGVTFFGGTNGNGPGTSGYGTVYSINNDGSGFQTLHVFSSQRATNGYGPAGGMALSGNTLYGTTSGGGTGGSGTIFKMDTSGSNFMVLKSFSNYGFDSNNLTNSDGEAPEGNLILSGDTLYGTTLGGGTNGGGGTVYSINTNGGNFTVLHSFSSPTDNGTGTYTNSGGGGTRSGLLLLQNTLYGTTPYGGKYGGGTVFAISLPLLPSLNIAPSGGKFTVEWPSSATNFMLQQNLTMNSLTWSNFSGAVNDDGTNKSISIMPAGGNAFFRLLSTNGL